MTTVGVGNNVTHRENSLLQSLLHVREVIKEQIPDIFEHHISQIAQAPSPLHKHQLHICKANKLQWNLPIVDTIGKQHL